MSFKTKIQNILVLNDIYFIHQVEIFISVFIE